MAEEILNDPFPDLKELENKVGRKTPESLLIWMRDAADCEDGWRSDVVDRGDRGSALSDSFSDKISNLKQEMVTIPIMSSALNASHYRYCMSVSVSLLICCDSASVCAACMCLCIFPYLPDAATCTTCFSNHCSVCSNDRNVKTTAFRSEPLHLLIFMCTDRHLLPVLSATPLAWLLSHSPPFISHILTGFLCSFPLRLTL